MNRETYTPQEEGEIGSGGSQLETEWPINTGRSCSPACRWEATGAAEVERAVGTELRSPHGVMWRVRSQTRTSGSTPARPRGWSS